VCVCACVCVGAVASANAWGRGGRLTKKNGAASVFFFFFFGHSAPPLSFRTPRPTPPEQLTPHPMLRVAASRAAGALRPSSLRAAAGATAARPFSVEGKFGDKERAEEVRERGERECARVGCGVVCRAAGGRGGKGNAGA
jgi:hypothetical protein